MTDHDVVSLLRAADRPRPLPSDLRSDVEAQLTGAAADLGRGDVPRPVPEDLRRRLEASLLNAPALPRRLDRRLTTALARPSSDLLRRSAAVAALVFVAGLLALSTARNAAEDHLATPTSPGEVEDAPIDDRSDTAVDGSQPGFPPLVDAPAGDGGTSSDDSPSSDGQQGEASSGADGPAAGPASGDVNDLLLVVDGGDTVAGRAFHAYLRLLNEAGGVDGRRVRTVTPDVDDVDADADADGAVASVNLGAGQVASEGGAVPAWVKGVLFETVHVDDAALRGAVTSLASPLEAQARLAVRLAFPDPSLGRRAAVYVDPATPWGDRVAASFEESLRERGVTPLRVPFDPNGPALVTADAAFLALPRDSVAVWLTEASRRPPPELGTWGVASAWDDAFVADAAHAGLHVLSPYSPATGEEARTLSAALDLPLSAEAVHGWVTAQAIAFLLSDSGGAALDEGSLDRLTGWRSSWAPPFETRARTRARTPEAVHLVAGDAGFVANGPFHRDG